MGFTQIQLKNWKNFRSANVRLPDRAFIIGPNASGKSNFLDAFRFLRDIASTGGLQQAVQERGGIAKVRCLQARNPSDIEITVTLEADGVQWHYQLAFTQKGSSGLAHVKKEMVVRNGETILKRPTPDEKSDDRQSEQTYLEQTSRNGDFRALADHFRQISYLHLVPQFIRGATGAAWDSRFPGMYGGRFLERVAATSTKKRESYLKKIREILQIAVPQLTELTLTTDKRGVPHLEARYQHWRPDGGRQDENQFSDGTLRLIALLWMLQDGSGLMLLEEPELSLHQGIVRQLAPFIYKAQTRTQITRQAFVSTHSVDLLSDPGIAAEEILLLTPTEDGTIIESGAESAEIRRLMAGGLTAAEAALPRTVHARMGQLSLFEL